MRKLAVVALSAGLLAGALAACSDGGASDGDATASTTDPATTDPSTAAPSTVAGTDAPAGDLDARLLDAAARTLEAERFTVDLRADITLPGDLVAYSATGWTDAAARTTDVEFASTNDGAEARYRLVSDGESVWATPPDPDALPAGKRWVRSDTVHLLGGTDQTEGLLRILHGLGGVTGWRDEGASLADDDTDVTEFSGRATYADLHGAAERGGNGDSFAAALMLHPTDVELLVTVQVDADGLIHRFDVRIDPDEATPLDGRVTLTLGDFGVPVEAPLPPEAAETVTGPDADRILTGLLIG